MKDLTSDSITCYTEYKCCGNIFRAHPSYRSTKEWYDWAYIKFYNVEKDENSLCPSKICCFVKDESFLFASWESPSFGGIFFFINYVLGWLAVGVML